jgi:arabinan endo-1,5-alpha-L-arabinosidase
MIRLKIALVPMRLAGCVTPTAHQEPPRWPIAIDADFPDPAVLPADDGFFYASATQGSVADRMINIQIARSRDLAQWERLGDALSVKPVWASRTQDF